VTSLKNIFLGTSAAEAIPSHFCRCSYCDQARKAGGKNIRSRSSFRIDSKHQIDFSPDVFYQMNQNQLDFSELEHLLITHTHKDHFDIAEILVKDNATVTNDKPINIYMSPEAAKWGESLLERYSTAYSEERKQEVLSKINIVPLQKYKTYPIGELVVTPIKGNHRAFGEKEFANNYLIQTKSGELMLYACDTGWYCQETWDFLKGKKADVVIMECTYGGRKDRGLHPDQHLDAPSFLLMLDRMQEIGFIQKETKIYASHIAHKQPYLHAELQQLFDQSPYEVTVAFDGLAINP
jgi:phosphoribosyl 1,2-cyclic phosphate phosphodiesterase